MGWFLLSAIYPDTIKVCKKIEQKVSSSNRRKNNGVKSNEKNSVLGRL